MDAAWRGDRGVGKELRAAGYANHLWSCNSALHRQLQTPCLDEQLARMSGRKGGGERDTKIERKKGRIHRHKKEKLQCGTGKGEKGEVNRGDKKVIDLV